MADGKPHKISDLNRELPIDLGLTAEELKERLPSGRSLTYKNRIGWARTYLGKASLIESPSRGVWQITDRGREVLTEGLDRIDVKYLKKFAEFKEFHSRKKGSTEAEEGETDQSQSTPEEQLERSHETLRDNVEQELLERVKAGSPDFFESLVVELLLRMGYGGFREEAGSVVGGSGDGGIDGVINEDRLGLDIVYVQAKRWKDTVGSQPVRNFAGSLDGVGANKGVMITTSTFSGSARQFVEKINKRIVLVDGEQLASLNPCMFEHELGASTSTTYSVKRVDSDYFEES